MDSVKAIFNIYFCDYGTVLVDKNKTVTIISKSCFRQKTCLTKLPILRSLTWWIQGLSRTCGTKFNDFQAPILFSSTFKALNLGEKIQVLSRMLGNPVTCNNCDCSSGVKHLDTVRAVLWVTHNFSTSPEDWTVLTLLPRLTISVFVQQLRDSVYNLEVVRL